MRGQDYRGIASGGVLAAVGSFIALYAASRYAVGTLHRIGPGMFPILLGILLAGFGLAIAGQALLRRDPEAAQWDEIPAIDLRQLAVVAGAIAGFALTVERFGVVPAIAVLVAITALARHRLGPVGLLVLAATLSITAVVIFPVLLGVPFRIFAWPFR